MAQLPLCSGGRWRNAKICAMHSLELSSHSDPFQGSMMFNAWMQVWNYDELCPAFKSGTGEGRPWTQNVGKMKEIEGTMENCETISYCQLEIFQKH